jgi:hypothetical protein
VIVMHRYLVERVEGAEVFRVQNLDAPLCPSCGSLCSGYDTRLRSVTGSDGCVAMYRLRRVRCPVCGILHLEMPDFMRPRKRYAAAVIDAVLEGHGECCPAEASTMWRWLRENHPPAMQCPKAGGMVQSTQSDTEEDEP